MTFLEPDDAVTAILGTFKSLWSDGELPEEAVLEIYAEKFVYDVIDYCHRDDFPKTLVYTAADLIMKRVRDQDGDTGGAPLKSITQNDTTMQFAVSDVASMGLMADADFESIKGKLNLYRKLVKP